MAKKLSDVFNKIKFAKIDPMHNKPHKGGSTDDEEHGAVSEIEFGQQVAHAKKRSMTESESVKRTQTNVKNVERAKTGFHIDDEEYRKHIERMKKANIEYIKNNPNSIYKMPKESVEVEEVLDALTEDLTEEISNDQIETLRVFYTVVKKIDKESPAWKRAVRSLSRFSKAQLKSISDLPFIGVEAQKMLHEDVEQLDEISDELADKVRDTRVAASKNWRNSKTARENLKKTSKNFQMNLDRAARKRRLNKDTPEVAKIKADANAEYEYNKSRGWSNESVETSEENSMNEAFSASASNKTHAGSFQEKEHGKHFTYKKTNDAWAKKHNLPHEIDVQDGVRYGHVKGTVAHVATDENPNGTPKIEKWKLKKHNKWVNESRVSDIVREAWEKSKKKKKEAETSDKVEKFEAEPELSSTIEKQ
jgi:hypothetical protein